MCFPTSRPSKISSIRPCNMASILFLIFATCTHSFLTKRLLKRIGRTDGYGSIATWSVLAVLACLSLRIEPLNCRTLVCPLLKCWRGVASTGRSVRTIFWWRHGWVLLGVLEEWCPNFTFRNMVSTASLPLPHVFLENWIIPLMGTTIALYCSSDCRFWEGLVP